MVDLIHGEAGAGEREKTMSGSGFFFRVECYSGYRGEETPRRLLLGERRIEVVEILDRWLAPDHRYFKLLGDDQSVYIVRHDGTTGRWELTMFDSAGQSPPGLSPSR